jgi:DNA-binding CsgD family transcriptional regulator
MKLSPTETRILQLICEGLDGKQITRRLNSNYWTIRTLRRRIHEKTGLSKATQLVVYAIRHGIYDPWEGQDRLSRSTRMQEIRA